MRIRALVSCLLAGGMALAGGAVVMASSAKTVPSAAEFVDLPQIMLPTVALTFDADAPRPVVTVVAVAEPPTAIRTDRLAPSSVSALRLQSNTMINFVVAWDAAYDETGIASYAIMINGKTILVTSQTSAVLEWPRIPGPVIVTVFAVDSAGNHGDWRALAILPPSSNPEPGTASLSRPATTPQPTVRYPTATSTPTTPSITHVMPSASTPPSQIVSTSTLVNTVES